MKGLFLFSIFFCSQKISAQNNVPELIGITMIGKTNKPIFDLYFIDSTRMGKLTFDIHTDVIYGDICLLRSVYSAFVAEDLLNQDTAIDYSFGTFQFFFLFDKNSQLKIIANPIHSAILLKKILHSLTGQNDDRAISELKYRLYRIGSK